MLSTNFEKRKEFYETDTTSQTPSGAGITSNKATPKIGYSKSDIDAEMLHSQISTKLRKAEQNYNEQRRRTVDRMKEHDKKVEEVRDNFYSHQEYPEQSMSKLG